MYHLLDAHDNSYPKRPTERHRWGFIWNRKLWEPTSYTAPNFKYIVIANDALYNKPHSVLHFGSEIEIYDAVYEFIA